jgi:hypothetical protein
MTGLLIWVLVTVIAVAGVVALIQLVDGDDDQ